MTNTDADPTDADLADADPAVAAVHELSSTAEVLLVIARAIEDRASGTAGMARDAAVLVKLGVLQLTTSAGRLIRKAERSRVVAEERRDSPPPFSSNQSKLLTEE